MTFPLQTDTYFMRKKEEGKLSRQEPLLTEELSEMKSCSP